MITRRHTKKYNTLRNIISWTYNLILRFLFNTTYRDISSGSRLVDRKILNKIKIDTNSPFLGAELTIKALYQGYKVSEVVFFITPQIFDQDPLLV